jgi:hypothetical protein
MAIKTQAQLEQASNSTYTTNGANAITAALVRDFNTDFISSSIVAPMTASMAVGSAISSSYAATASLLLGSIASASYALSASHADNADNAISASFASTASSVNTLNQVVRIVGPGTTALIITGSNQASTTFSPSLNLISTINAPGINADAQVYSSDTGVAGQYIGALKSDYSVDVEHAIIVSTSSVTLNDWDNNAAAYVPYLTIAPNTGNNPAPVFTRGLGVSGSVNGNVQAITVSSNTASIDLSTGNFFTVTLANSATTFFNVTNATPGLTTNLVLTTGTVSSASFSSNVKQPTGSAYLPTSGSGQIDVLSLVAVDTSSVYLVASKKFV